ncbi:hypothetical protein ACX9R5_08020 [Rathayibacter sp. CAU 1779]
MQLRLLTKHLLNSREFGLGYWWIDGLTYEATEAGSDRDLLAALIADPWYHHSYAAPRGDVPDLNDREIHGPYRIPAIEPRAFVRTDHNHAVRRLDDWLDQNDSRASATAAFQGLIRELLPTGYTIYELPDLGDSSRHEWGWVVGSDTGFVEYVAISPDSKTLNLLVATDD